MAVVKIPLPEAAQKRLQQSQSLIERMEREVGAAVVNMLTGLTTLAAKVEKEKQVLRTNLMAIATANIDENLIVSVQVDEDTLTVETKQTPAREEDAPESGSTQ